MKKKVFMTLTLSKKHFFYGVNSSKGSVNVTDNVKGFLKQKSFRTTALQHCNKILNLGKNQHTTIITTFCNTEFRENICLKMTWPNVRLLKYGE